MKKTRIVATLLSLALLGAVGIGVVNAETTITHYPDSNVEYTLNSGFDTEHTFTAGTITISDGTTTITMLDRNLGATKAGTGCEDSSRSAACMNGTEDETYGYHFQWGNNYGFVPCTDGYGCNTFPGEENTDDTQVDTSGYGPGNWYVSGTFVLYGHGNWDASTNDNLRGGSGDTESNSFPVTNPTNRQGPCPEGFHVPSIGEWNNLLNMLGATDSEKLNKLHNELLIPFAGFRDYDGVWGLGLCSYLWSSSPSDPSNAQVFGIGVNEYLEVGDSYRAQGFSVRCLKDSYLEFPSIEDGGDTTGQVTLTLTAGENTCTLQDYNLGMHNVSSEDQNVSTSGQNIVCEFLKNTSATIQLSMGDLVDGTKEIGRQNFTGIVTSLGSSLGTIANLTGGSYNFSGSHIIYTKQANTIGTWTGSLAIEGIIPAGTPSGEYTGELNVIICEGC